MNQQYFFLQQQHIYSAIKLIQVHTYIYHFWCFQGTFNTYEGLINETQCTPCLAGDYCGVEGLNTTSGPCAAGFYCPPGQDTASPVTYPCTLAHYCPGQTVIPIPCANGTYMNHTQGAACYTCPAGS
ncbi:hypothetical protein DPMN_185092 [Dreissena polymorpha]|uniref:Tyrosine-protein kinase ephrin type A/B receptor-like domain-containing protein n=1 Tax=Dreissena polymorpha TaxID=45954 RepID=A0A9D4I6Z6_DREPO|nr:hypothetical protein DPMN_185092 [Dreissena polymorpha]